MRLIELPDLIVRHFDCGVLTIVRNHNEIHIGGVIILGDGSLEHQRILNIALSEH